MATVSTSASAPFSDASPTAAQAGPSVSAAAAQHANMHLDTTTGKWMYENTETGQEFEWNTVANVWVPVVDEEETKKQQAAYSVQGVDDTTPAAVVLARDRKKNKRKAGEDGEDTEAKKKKAAKQKQGPRNTAVYVQGLPTDATVEEVSAAFSKAGLILLDADGQPKIKLYTNNETGQRNGEGLVVYYKEESIVLAQNLFDDAPLRLGGQQNMKVAKADWGHKADSKADEEDGESNKKKKKSNAEAQKMQRRAEKLQKDAADYDPSYDERQLDVAALTATGNASMSGTNKTGAGGRIVVLAHVFTLQELAEDASLLLDLKEDIRDECETLGKVTNVVLYDKEPDGIVTIKFSDPISAQACVLKNNNRFFGGQQLKAWLYDGKTRYSKSGSLDTLANEGETEDQAEQRRLAEFGKWLEEDGA